MSPPSLEAVKQRLKRALERVGRCHRAHSSPEQGLPGIGVSASLPCGRPGLDSLAARPWVPLQAVWWCPWSLSTRRRWHLPPNQNDPPEMSAAIAECPLGGTRTLLRTPELAGTEGPFCPQIPGLILLPGQPPPSSLFTVLQPFCCYGNWAFSCLSISLPTSFIPSFNQRNPCVEPGGRHHRQPSVSSPVRPERQSLTSQG